MAEIEVGPRRTGPWPWIVGLLVLTLLVWVVADAMVGRAPQTPADDRSTQGASEPQPQPAPPPWPVASITHAAAAAA